MAKSERASQIRAVLAFAAKNRQSLTYGILSKLIGVPAAGLGKLLEPIKSYCLIEGSQRVRSSFTLHTLGNSSFTIRTRHVHIAVSQTPTSNIKVKT